ncbi:MAG: hypothetical protein RLZZ545_993 [Actinomycetota bacterium]
MKELLFAQTLRKTEPGEGGWRRLQPSSDPVRLPVPTNKIRTPLINLIHISDTHICDAQSPARVEYLDRFADPHHPAAALIGTLIGTYRAHEIFTVHVMQSMIDAINTLDLGPVTHNFIDAVLVTGDLTDNAQKNELQWCSTLMAGGVITPDSGSPHRWEGAGGERYSPFFWNPHGTPAGESDDFPRKLYGYPEIPELLDAIRSPFVASGIKHEVLPVHGNHDALLQGTVAPDQFLHELAKSDLKIFELPDEEALRALGNVTEVGPSSYPKPVNPKHMPVTADSSRAFVHPQSWAESFPLYEPLGQIKYWRKDYDRVSLIALDTVNPYGGWQGSLDRTQFEWLQHQLDSLEGRLAIITSHHPLQDMFNGYTPHGQTRVLQEEIEELLRSRKEVIAWLCGHTHRHRITYFGANPSQGFWQIETASLIDWPQEGRIIEVFIDEANQVCIATLPFGHQGIIHKDYTKLDISDTDHLAGLSRDLSVNDWQRRGGSYAIELNEGESIDRTALLILTHRI